MFGGFKASLKILGGGVGKRNKNYELAPDMNVSGAYRASRDDPYGFNTYTQETKNGTRTLEDVIPHIRPAKSTPNLTQPRPVIPKLRNSTQEISSDPRGAESDRNRNSTNLVKEKNKKIEKQRAAEEKARQKQIAQERAKEEKLMKEQEKRDAKLAKEKAKRKSKQPAPQPAAQPNQQIAPQSAKQSAQQTAKQSAQQTAPQSAQQTAPQSAQQTAPQSAQQTAPQRPRRAQQSQRDNSNPSAQIPYSTNTLESSISRSTGPPPYAEDPDELNEDITGNVTYRKPKPKDEGSWDMITQHRQQIARPNTSANVSKQNKQMVMDLNYNFEHRVAKENSEA